MGAPARRYQAWISGILSKLRTGGAYWRYFAYWGSRYGPRVWVRYSPGIFGCVFAALLPEVRHRVERNLRRTLGKRSWLLEQLDVYRTFANYAHCLAESLAGERPEAREAKRRTLGEEHLRSALDQGRGLVVVTGHVGAWDVAARLLRADWGVPVVVVMQREADPAAARLHDRLRALDGVKVAHLNHPLDSLELLSHLRRGGALAVQLDRLPSGTRFLEGFLFGEPFRVPEGPFRLAAMAEAPVLPVFALRTGFFEYELHVGQALVLPRRPDPVASQRAVQTALDALEKIVRECPTQWFHFESNQRSARSEP
jgi:KDO2-lipid IV(A) lauroyltransferase